MEAETYSYDELDKMTKSQIIEKGNEISKKLSIPFSFKKSDRKQELINNILSILRKNHEKTRTVSSPKLLPPFEKKTLTKSKAKLDEEKLKEYIDQKIEEKISTKKNKEKIVDFVQNDDFLKINNENNIDLENHNFLSNSLKKVINSANHPRLEHLSMHKHHHTMIDEIVRECEKEFDHKLFALVAFYVGLFQGLFVISLPENISNFFNETLSQINSQKVIEKEIDEPFIVKKSNLTRALSQLVDESDIPYSKFDQKRLFNSELERRINSNPIDRLKAQRAISEYYDEKFDNYLRLSELKEMAKKIIQENEKDMDV